jgi:AraC family transcriptional regulator
MLSSVMAGWAPSLTFEGHHMPPHVYREHVLVGHRLIVNLGDAVRFGWKRGDQTREASLQTGGLCLQTEGDLNAPFWRDEMTFAAVAIAPELVERLLEERTPSPTATFLERRCYDEPTAYAYARALAAELSSPSEPTYAEALGHALTLHLLSAHGQAEGGKRLAPRGKLGPGQLRVAVDLAHERLSGGVALEEIAGAVGYSPFQFARLFKATVGLAPHQYLLRLRLERAQRLIGQGLGLAEAALASGFYDQAHMTNVFRKQLGRTPSSLQPA